MSIIVSFDHANAVIIIKSSPTRLIEGGRARLVRLAISHHSAMRGSSVCKPRARIIVRLWMRS